MKDALSNTDPVCYTFTYNMTLVTFKFFQSMPVLIVASFKTTPSFSLDGKKI